MTLPPLYAFYVEDSYRDPEIRGFALYEIDPVNKTLISHTEETDGYLDLGLEDFIGKIKRKFMNRRIVTANINSKSDFYGLRYKEIDTQDGTSVTHNKIPNVGIHYLSQSGIKVESLDDHLDTESHHFKYD